MTDEKPLRKVGIHRAAVERDCDECGHFGTVIVPGETFRRLYYGQARLRCSQCGELQEL